MCAIGNWVVCGAALDGGAWAARYESEFHSNTLANANGSIVDSEVGDDYSSDGTVDGDKLCHKIQEDNSPTERD